MRIVLRGGSVIDWHRLNFESEEQVRDFLRVQEIDLDHPVDRARCEAVKHAAIAYLRRNFDFPVPRPVAALDVAGLIMLASSKGHRQLCACTILKVMHIIHHLDARELLFVLPVSDADLFHLVEQKVYRAIGGMLAQGYPILEFIGGRKNRDSLYTKLLSKKETLAAQIYDKIRFRIVTRTLDDVMPVLYGLTRELFPFNYVIPGQSTNTLLHFQRYCEGHPHLRKLLPRLQLPLSVEEEDRPPENRFSSADYRVAHFVADMPIRLPQSILDAAPPAAWPLGRITFVQTEFQIVDRDTEQQNETGEASHEAYKRRQRLAVMRRLKLGREPSARTVTSAARPTPRPERPPSRPPATVAAATTTGSSRPPRRDG